MLPSKLAWPRVLSLADLARLKALYVEAACLCIEAGFAAIEDVPLIIDLSSVTESSDPNLLNVFILGMDRAFLYIGILCIVGSIISLYRRPLK